MSSTPLQDDGMPGSLAFITDITELREAEQALRASQEQLTAVLKHSSDIITVFNADKSWRFTSGAAERLGHSLDGPPVASVFARMHPDDMEEAMEGFEKIMVSGHGTESRQIVRIKAPDESWRVLDIVRQNLIDDPDINGIVIHARDITEKVETEAALHAAEARTRQLEDVLSQSDEVVILTDTDGNIVWGNKKAQGLFELTSVDHIAELTTSESLERLLDEIIPFVRERGLWRGELTLVTKDGTEIPIVGTLQAHRDESSVVIMSTIAHDITELKAIEERLRYEATHDPLTGLPNRTMFHEIGEQALSRAVRHATITGVLFLDLDGFKVVNDDLGHAVGDSALIEIARRLRVGVRSGDIVTRLGGDEFCVLCERISDENEARQLARRLVDIVSKPQMLGDRSVMVGASIGIAIDQAGSTTFDKLIRNADVALYQAKQAGGGQIASFGGFDAQGSQPSA